MQAMTAAMQGGRERPTINLSVIHVANQHEAERVSAQEQAKGHEVAIVNAVLKNLSVGEASSINRALRGLQR